jgi:glycine/D-amino acid oxidase-like deaminating enzyme
VSGIDGAYVATGPSVWGMLNVPATCEAMCELILDGSARHVDFAPFTPDRRCCAAPQLHAAAELKLLKEVSGAVLCSL